MSCCCNPYPDRDHVVSYLADCSEEERTAILLEAIQEKGNMQEWDDYDPAPLLREPVFEAASEEEHARWRGYCIEADGLGQVPKVLEQFLVTQRASEPQPDNWERWMALHRQAEDQRIKDQNHDYLQAMHEARERKGLNNS